MDHKPEEETQDQKQEQDEEELSLIDPEMFWDLLMEEQEQM